MANRVKFGKGGKDFHIVSRPTTVYCVLFTLLALTISYQQECPMYNMSLLRRVQYSWEECTQHFQHVLVPWRRCFINIVFKMCSLPLTIKVTAFIVLITYKFIFGLNLTRAHMFLVYVKGNVIRSGWESIYLNPHIKYHKSTVCPTKFMAIEEKLMPYFYPEVIIMMKHEWMLENSVKFVVSSEETLADGLLVRQNKYHSGTSCKHHRRT